MIISEIFKDYHFEGLYDIPTFQCYYETEHEPVDDNSSNDGDGEKGKMLACFCRPETACHDDTLSHLANSS